MHYHLTKLISLAPQIRSSLANVLPQKLLGFLINDLALGNKFLMHNTTFPVLIPMTNLPNRTLSSAFEALVQFETSGTNIVTISLADLRCLTKNFTLLSLRSCPKLNHRLQNKCGHENTNVATSQMNRAMSLNLIKGIAYSHCTRKRVYCYLLARYKSSQRIV